MFTRKEVFFLNLTCLRRCFSGLVSNRFFVGDSIAIEELVVLQSQHCAIMYIAEFRSDLFYDYHITTRLADL